MLGLDIISLDEYVSGFISIMYNNYALYYVIIVVKDNVSYNC